MQPDPRFDLQLEADLGAAGAIARSAADQAPTPAFAYGLRSQLLTAHAAAGAVRATHAFPRRSRFSRFAPVFAMMLALALATVVAAGAFRLFGPQSTPRPAPTPSCRCDGTGGWSHVHPDAEPDADRIAHSHAYPDAEPDTHPEPDADPDADPDAGADPRADPGAGPRADAAADPGAHPDDRVDVPRPHRLPGRGGHRVVAGLRSDVREVPHAPQRLG